MAVLEDITPNSEGSPNPGRSASPTNIQVGDQPTPFRPITPPTLESDTSGLQNLLLQPQQQHLQPQSQPQLDPTVIRTPSEGPPPPLQPSSPAAPLTRPRRHPELTRDQKIEVRALRKYAKMKYEDIAKATGFSMRQVQHACNSPPTPQRKGRPKKDAGKSS